MTLKEEILFVEQNKIKLDKAFYNINSKLLEIGNKNAKNLGEVPALFENQVNTNFKKIAVIKKDIDLESAGSYWTAICEIPINLNFNPTRILVRYDVLERDGEVIAGSYDADSKYENVCDMDGYVSMNKFVIKSFNRTKIIVEHAFGNSAYGRGWARVKKIVVIG